MNTPTPALLTQAAARRLPRLALLLFCAAYLLPGVFGRDPWRNADLANFGVMVAIAEGRSPWLAPTLGSVAVDASPLPHWLGALSISLLSPLVEPALAARLPFALLLALVLALTWYATFHLARTDAALPAAFAFGGEAAPVDYARAIADGALLALIATLGLLQLGHETTPELAQLCAVGLFLYGLAAAPFRRWQARAAVLVALPMLASSGAASVALALGLAGAGVCALSGYTPVRALARWVLASTGAAALAALTIGALRWRLAPGFDVELALTVARQWLWFLWPVWPLVLWTLWQWRRHLWHRHLAVPLATVLVALAANLALGGSDRALMLALPGMAVLAAFALPTMARSTTAAIDWFSMFFFTLSAAAIWVIYAAFQTGVPAKPAANVAKLAPGFVAHLSWPALLLAFAATLAWLWLVRWRSGRHQQAVWKSLVLPAGGVALCWLLLMTLWLPLLDYARSSRPLIDRLAAIVPPGSCVAGIDLSLPFIAALEHHGRYRVDALPGAAQRDCDVLLQVTPRRPLPPTPLGWTSSAELQRPTDRDEVTAVYHRSAAR